MRRGSQLDGPCPTCGRLLPTSGFDRFKSLELGLEPPVWPVLLLLTVDYYYL